MDSQPASEYTCACGHRVGAHFAPSAPREPWGECRALVQHGKQVSRCDCREAWPVEEGDKQ